MRPDVEILFLVVCCLLRKLNCEVKLSGDEIREMKHILGGARVIEARNEEEDTVTIRLVFGVAPVEGKEVN